MFYLNTRRSYPDQVESWRLIQYQHDGYEKPELCRKLLERKFEKLKIPHEEDVDEEELCLFGICCVSNVKSTSFRRRISGSQSTLISAPEKEKKTTTTTKTKTTQ